MLGESQQDLLEVPDDPPLWPVRSVIGRRALVDPGRLEVAWGEGPRRQSFRTASPALATLLVGLRGPITRAQLAQRITEAAELPSERAQEIADRLVADGLLVSEPSEPTASERTWSGIGWRDAAVLHAATRLSGGSADEARAAPQAEPLPLPRDTVSARAIPLPPASARLEHVPALDAVRRRRTHRNFNGTTLSVQDLADILHWTFRPVVPAGRRNLHTTGFSPARRDEHAAASPVTAFLLLDPKNGPAELLDVDWRFRYSPAHHALEPTGSGRPKMESISDLLWDQDFSVGAPAFVIFAVNWAEYMTRVPASHAYRLTQFDLGAFMQTALTVAAALDVRTFLTPALDDERFARILGTEDSEQAPSYMLALGTRPR
ncbi:hypothetical protein F8568_020320 [Actinomadura sp. LD22]|uniref:Nitroreductase domain-containing protein n=1 Tax=Actinomadura physcomitrii TaxID=2650748 RepID=A0A6I4MFC7_9ACTN|nr:nitroreductase family protein [Actinomadura physcomitrii]MWA02677.1 hypothetical protein [Actinomadura physcomitrii]